MGKFQQVLLTGSGDASLALASAQRAAIQGRFVTPGLPRHLQPSHPLSWASLYVSGA
jgi:hypothetical protein